ncbi:MAG: hypothetical protein AAB628_00065 [Patescibacteria group bacterium]
MEELNSFVESVSNFISGSFVVNLFPLIVIWYLPQLVVYFFAKLKIIWLLKEEGHANGIKKTGLFHDMRLAYHGHKFKGKVEGAETKEGYDRFDEYEIVPDSIQHEDAKSLGSKIKAILFPMSGISFIGIPPSYENHKYTHHWPDDKYVQRIEDVDSILVQKYVYGVKLESIELQGGLRFNIKLQITLQVVNPAKALFRITRWLDASLDRIRGWARDEFCHLPYSAFVAPTKARDYVKKDSEKVQQSLEDEPSETTIKDKLVVSINKIIALSEKLITSEFGVKVLLIQVAGIEPADEKAITYTTMQEEATRDASALIEKSYGKAEALKITNEVAKGLSQNAVYIQYLETLGKTGSNIIVNGESGPKSTPVSIILPSNYIEGKK